ncbi:zf-HC2 domain-containing protein [Streptomyces cyaneofuscatus]|uniref:zf-HC2 domain-containing protein n=1 Tax=Streptomyces cyaneofuscatus TaxID=66883 RepID=UPI00364CA3E6
MNGDGREGGRRDDEVRGARRIPGPRGAVDDLDLETAERPVLPPPGSAAPEGAVPEQGVPEGEAGDAEEAVPEVGAADEAEDAVHEPCEPYAPDEPDQPEEPDEAGPAFEPVTPHAVTADASAPSLSHRVLKALLGAWALSACSAEETAAVEDHLTGCAPCADEALRLRDAVGLLHTDGSLDLDPTLRTRVLDGCLGRRPARVPIPEWATAYDAETARLDALLRDIGDSDWHAPVRLQWFEDERAVTRRTTVAGVIGHLMAVDGLLSAALGLDDPLAGTGALGGMRTGTGARVGTEAPGGGAEVPLSPTRRTETYWAATYPPATRAVREPWRALTHDLIRTAALAGPNAAERSVSYGEFALPLQDALLDRAFECWVHGTDIAEAVDYPYRPPSAAHLHRMIDLAARMLPAALAGRRRAGLAGPARELVAPGEPGRSVHLEVEGHGGGDWYIALDSPAAVGSRDRAVAQVALDGVEFCRLVAGHISPVEAAAGQEGDREAIRDVLFASASLSRL